MFDILINRSKIYSIFKYDGFFGRALQWEMFSKQSIETIFFFQMTEIMSTLKRTMLINQYNINLVIPVLELN